MQRRNLASLFISFACLTAAACAESSPVAPAPSAGTAQEVSFSAQSVPGCYDLSFLDNSLQPVATLVVGQELILKAHVDNCSGSPAERGAVAFQYCSYRGLPPNDITRPDEAPLAACESGDAMWRTLLTLKVNASGDALMNFGFVSIPRTIGFRFKYQSQGSGIDSGVSNPADFTWTAAL